MSQLANFGESIEKLDIEEMLDESVEKEMARAANKRFNFSTNFVRDENFVLRVQQADPTSPLHSIKTFEQLRIKAELLRGVYAMGFNAPSKIQEYALPILFADPPQNMIAQSQSGTGKTAAFVLAMLSRVVAAKNHPQVICLSPTYELAVQTGEIAAQMAAFSKDIRIRMAVSFESNPPGSQLTEHILVGTPGKMLDWALKFKFFDLNKITVFVLDEADVMISGQGHRDQCIRIYKNLSRQCQSIFFSATYNKYVMNFAELMVPEPTIIRLLKDEEILDNIKQYFVKCKSTNSKYAAIRNIYGSIGIGQAIIFCRTRATASWLARQLLQDGHAASILSSDLPVQSRLAVLDRFRCGIDKVLISTNVLSRGIDVVQVTTVVNFDLPVDARGKVDYETYLHRIGRTGRFGRDGVAINLVEDTKSIAACRAIEAHFKKEIKLLDVDDFEEVAKIGK